MYHLCPACKTWIIQNPSEQIEYTATMLRKRDQHLYDNYIIINTNLDEVDKILEDYISIHYRKFY